MEAAISKTHDFSFSEGETFYFLFALRDASGLPLDLTGGSVEWAVSSITDSSSVFIATTANGLIIVTDPTGGLGYVRIDPVDHAVLPGGEYTHALRAILASGLVSEQMSGRMTIGESPFGTIDGGQSFLRSTGLQLIYSSNTDEGDPGDGQFRFNSGFTEAYVDLEDRFGVDITDWLEALDDSTNGVPYGFIRFTKVGTESTWYEFEIIGGVVSATGYRKLLISLIAGQGSLTDGDGFALSWSRTGDGSGFGVDFSFFGGVGDGATDNADAFDAAHVYLDAQLTAGTTPVLVFRPGTYKTSRPADFTSLRNATTDTIIRGNGALIWGYDGCADKCVIDLMGSQHLRVEDLHVKGDTTDTPNIGIQYGRIAYQSGYKGQTASHIDFSGCSSTGQFLWAATYNFASELHHEDNCTWRNEIVSDVPDEGTITTGTDCIGKSYCSIIDSGNQWGITSDYVTISIPQGGAVSCLDQNFGTVAWMRPNGGNTLWIGSGCNQINMTGCYVACKDGDAVIIYLERYHNANPSPGFRQVMYDWHFDLHCEADTPTDSGLTFKNGFRIIPADGNSGVAVQMSWKNFTFNDNNYQGDDTVFLLSQLFPSGSNVRVTNANIAIGSWHGSASAASDDGGPPNLGVFYPAGAWSVSGDLQFPTTDTYSGTHSVGLTGRFFPSSSGSANAWYPLGSYEIMRAGDHQPALHKGDHWFGLDDTTTTWSGSDIPFTHYVGFESGKVSFSGGPIIEHGSGSPEGVVTADKGSKYIDVDGTVGLQHYRKTSGSGTTGWTATFVPADITNTAGAFWGGTIWRMQDRLFVGESAANFLGNSAATDGGTSWLSDSTTAPAYLGINATILGLASAAAGGPYGVVGGSKTSLNISTGGIGVGSAIVNDKAAGRAWAYIAEVQHETGSYSSHGAEFAVKNKSADNFTYTPYTATFGTFGIRLSGGGDNAFGGSAANPSNTAVLIIKNAHTWNQGLVIFADAITGQTGALGDDSANVTAISMGRRQVLTWYEPTNGASGAFIFSSVNAHANRVAIEFADDKVKLLGAGSDILVQVNHVASAVNHLEFDNSATGNPPILKSIGTDSNISLQLTAKGTGVVKSTNTIQGPTATTSIATFNLPHGAAPSSPVNGDMWTTTAGLYIRINGSTVGPLS